MNIALKQCVNFCIALFALFIAHAHTHAAPALPEDNSKAVILAYHRIGEDHIPDQSITLEQFHAHIREIKAGNYNVLPLTDIIKAISNGETLPTKTLGITLEGAYRSALKNGVPLLLDAEIPFTVFYASNSLDQKDPIFTSWEHLKTLSKEPNVILATLPASYEHIAHRSKQDILKNLNKARQRYRENFEKETTLLSYPFGEYSTELKQLAQSQGYEAAIGLHSGAVFNGSDLYAIPRFSMTESYGDLERFRLVTNALPLPVQDIEPANPILTEDQFFTGFTLPEKLAEQSKALSCFISGEATPIIERLGSRIEIRSQTPTQSRARLNCTMSGPVSENDEIQWRWLGLLYHRASEPPKNP